MAMRDLLLDKRFRTGWRQGAVWSLCIAAIALLGTVRVATDAEFAFASLTLLPVLAMGWFGGLGRGWVVSFVGTSMWLVADLVSHREFSAAWIPWLNWATRLMTYGLLAWLVALVRRQWEREIDRAVHDPLTGLKNRRGLLEDGANEVKRAMRYAHPLAVIYLDLDNFKQLNDSRGHEAGDEALLETGKALLGTLRATDRAARLGGDEFAILLPEISFEAATETGKRLAVTLKQRLAPYRPVGASIGVAWFPAATRTFADMLKAADDLMYAAKERDKGSVQARRFDAA